jgi:prepilin peptidase CpaA
MTNELNMMDFLPAYVLVATMLIALVTDIVTHRIPNNLLAPALVLALLIGTETGGINGLMLSLGGLAVGFAMLLPIYMMGAMGAGDVKLLAVAGAFLGPEGALFAGLGTFVAGAILGLAWLAWRAVRPVVDHWMAKLMQAHHAGLPQMITLYQATKPATFSIAYAPAIAAGVGFAIWQQGWPIPTLMV